MAAADKKLHWTQRVALVRHNLHAARRTGDFTFFKALQAQLFRDGTDHVATLTALLGDEADTVLSTLDNLNAGIAYVHQDAFKNVYDNLKASICDDLDGGNMHGRRAKLRVDASQQKQMADFAIDKMTSSAIALVQQQPAACQDAVAAIWVTGTTIIADAVKVCLDQADQLEHRMDDFIQLEYTWSTVQSAVDGAISALRGIFNLMAATTTTPAPAATESDGIRSRASSSASFGMDMFRRLSTALSSSSTAHMGPPPPPLYKHSRNPSVQSLPPTPTPTPTTPSRLRASMSAACPTAMPSRVVMPSTPIGIAPHTVLTPIPPTPACVDGMINPFDRTPAS